MANPDREQLRLAAERVLKLLGKDWKPLPTAEAGDNEREAIDRIIKAGLAVERLTVTLSTEGLPRVRARCERRGFRPFLPSGANRLAETLAGFVPGFKDGKAVLAYTDREWRLSSDGEEFLGHQDSWYFDKWLADYLTSPSKKVIDGEFSVVGDVDVLPRGEYLSNTPEATQSIDVDANPTIAIDSVKKSPPAEVATRSNSETPQPTTSDSNLDLFVALLNEHHKYGKPGNWLNTPISARDLARESKKDGCNGFSPSTASRLFKTHFGSHKSYVGFCQQGILHLRLKLLNRDKIDFSAINPGALDKHPAHHDD